MLPVAVDLDRDVEVAFLRSHVAGLYRAADTEVERQSDHARPGPDGLSRCSVTRAVVDDDDLDWRLGPDVGDHLADRVALLKGRHDREAAGEGHAGSGAFADGRGLHAAARLPSGIVEDPVAASVVIVNYRGRGRLGRCLDALAASSATCRFETLVIDNASDDGSWDEATSRDGCRTRAQPRERRLRARLQPGGRARPRPPPRLPQLRLRAQAGLARRARALCRRRPGRGRRAGRRAAPRRHGQHGGQPAALSRLLVGAEWRIAARRAASGDRGRLGRLPARAGAALSRGRRVLGGHVPLLRGHGSLLAHPPRRAACRSSARKHASFTTTTSAAMPSKFFHLERNRLLMLAANYEAGTLPGSRLRWSRQKSRCSGSRARWLAAAEAALARLRRTGHAGRAGTAAGRRPPAADPDGAFSTQLERRLGPEFGEGIADASASTLGIRPPRRAALAAAAPEWRGTASSGDRSGEPRDGLGERALRIRLSRELPPGPCLRRTGERVAE